MLFSELADANHFANLCTLKDAVISVLWLPFVFELLLAWTKHTSPVSCQVA